MLPRVLPATGTVPSLFARLRVNPHTVAGGSRAARVLVPAVLPTASQYSAQGSRSVPTSSFATRGMASKLPDDSRRLVNKEESISFTPRAVQELESDPILLDIGEMYRSAVLNRPKALNALNLDMVQKLTTLFETWGENRDVRVVALQGAGTKAFCAGGDIVALYKSGLAKDGWTTDFFREEYQLDHMIADSPCTTVAIMDGITMGGGVGLTINSDIRIVTENTVFAMPETGIGFFPDVGGSHFMSRIPTSGLGMYLSLTGHRIKGADVVRCGIGTHYVPTDRLEELLTHLQAIPGESFGKLAFVRELIEIYADEVLPGTDSLQAHYDAIARCFHQKRSVEEIFAALEAEKSEWANKQLKTLRRMSPTSLKVTLEQMNRGRTLSIGDCFKMEFRMAQHFMNGKDFFEGVRALLIDKDNKPQWSPASVEEVSEAEVKSYFEPIGEELQLHPKIIKGMSPPPSSSLSPYFVSSFSTPASAVSPSTCLPSSTHRQRVKSKL
eukprot:TRINITY_DN6508_c0_g1_i9.p1 TRINITY_DN6508_c0_g1~~TRINITY_DN6508_c0_g1_i9.p1  ORF type:complete len:498 (+),score=106.08 TRINITY_DN6508_c0_g1_i9:242-1735(+)